jgi:large subunit ribosomal protein L24
MKLRTGDTVVIISGKDKGKTGSILRILPNTNRVVVTDINMRTRHIKATPQQPGQKIRYEASINASNVMLVDPKTKKRTRVGYATEKGKKFRIAKKSGEKITGSSKTKAKATEAPKGAKKGFWNRTEKADTHEVKEGSHMSVDHSVTEQTTRTSTRSHSRGS